MNAIDVRNSRLNADVWDLTGIAMKSLGETWPPDEPGGPIYAALSGIYAFLAGAIVLFVMLASMFMEQVALATDYRRPAFHFQCFSDSALADSSACTHIDPPASIKDRRDTSSGRVRASCQPVPAISMA